jgi:CopG family nickel-responsive transcriptional regulator
MLRRFGVSLPDALLEKFDRLIERRGYSNRSEAIRDMIRATLVEEEWAANTGEVVAALTIVYDHHSSDISHRLLGIQHDAHDTILSTMHIHMDAHNCMEVLVLRGAAQRVEDVANRLISARGVKHGKLFRTTRGVGL